MIRPKPELVRAAERVKPADFRDARQYLDAVYLRLKDGKEHYSYFQFAKDLGFSYSNVLHLIIRGKRRITERTLNRIADGLGLAESDRMFLLSLVEYTQAHDATRRKFYRERLESLGRPGTRLECARFLIPTQNADEAAAAYQAFKERLAALSQSERTPALVVSLCLSEPT